MHYMYMCVFLTCSARFSAYFVFFFFSSRCAACGGGGGAGKGSARDAEWETSPRVCPWSSLWSHLYMCPLNKKLTRPTQEGSAPPLPPFLPPPPPHASPFPF